MSVNVDEAFSVEEFGIKTTDEDGNTKLYITSGQGSPQGTPSQVATIYIDELTGDIYKKFGVNDNDWTRADSGVQSGVLSLGGNILGQAFTSEEIVGGDSL